GFATVLAAVNWTFFLAMLLYYHCLLEGRRQMRTPYCFVGILALLFPPVLPCRSQEPAQNININVHADQPDGPVFPIWNYFGYDEPNYTYAPNGKKLLGELATLSPTPVYVRTHNLLTTGDGSASLKWGSTNVYTEDAAGKPVYSWPILDRIFDT